MESTGGGKMRQKRSHGASKPYQRTRPKSFLDKVKDLVTPSWLSSMWSSGTRDEPPPQASSARAPTSSANSIPPRGSITDSQYPGLTEAESAPGPSVRPTQAGRFAGQGEGQLNTPILGSFGGLSVPVSTSTPIDVDEEVIEIDSGEGPSTQKVDDPSEFSAPPSVVSSLYPNLDKLEHQQKLSESNLDLLSEMGHRRSPMPSSGLWSTTPSSRSVTTRARPASPFSRPQQPAISTRRPAFNTSYFGTPRGSLRTSSVMESTTSSPFYPGKTTYGGASAQRSTAAVKRSRSSPYEVHLPIKRSVRPRLAKPTDEGDMGITSNTAKRILDTLEKMSTPLSDAKRIPLSPSVTPLAFTASRAPKLRGPSSPHRPLGLGSKGGVRIPGPPVSGLSIPHTVSIAPNRQPPIPTTATTTTTREGQETVGTDTVTSRARSTLPSATTSIGFSFGQSAPAFTTLPPPPIARIETPPSQTAPLQRSSSGGKMKQKRNSSHYSANKEDKDDDVVEVIDLPNIPLPLKTLPSFSFGKPLEPPKSTAPSTSTSVAAPPSTGRGFRFATSTPAVAATVPAAKMDSNHEFTFASPILRQTASTISAPEFETAEFPPQAFTFSLPKKPDVSPSVASSKPLNFNNPSSSSSNKSSSLAAASAPSFGASNTVKSPSKEESQEEEEEEEQGFGIKPAKTLKSGSCLEVFGIVAPTEPAATTAPVTTSASVNDLFGKFKSQPDAWSCDTCLLQNKAEDSACVACQSPRPAPAAKSNVTTESGDNTTVPTSDLLAKVTPPAGTWTCSVCLLQNKSDADKCVACESPNPAEKQKSAPLNNSLLDKFRPPPGGWTCDACLVQNKADADKCISCTTPKPNAGGSNPTPFGNTLTNSTPKGGFGSKMDTADSRDTNSKTDNFMDKFKSPLVSWSCDTCLVQNKESADRCIACETPKPGSQPSLKTPPASAFKFGSQSTTPSSGAKLDGITFGGTSNDSSFKFSTSKFTAPTSGGFSFGAPNKTSTSSESGGIQFGLPKNGSATGFRIGSNADSETKTNSLTAADGVQFGSDTSSKADGGFKFGAPAVTSTESKQDKPAISSGFSFGAPSTTKSDSVPPNADPFKDTVPSTTSFGSGGLGANAVTTSTQETDSKAEQKQGFMFGSSKDDTKVNFGSSVTEQSTFSFGGKAPTESAPKPTTFQFSASANPPASTAQQAADKPAFNFGATPSAPEDAPKVVSVSSGFSFGGSAVNAVDTAQQQPHLNSVAPTFQFGKSSAGTDEAGTGQPPLKKGVTFASPIEQETASGLNPSFGFGGAPSQAATQGSPFMFGATDNKVDAPSKPNGGITFGTPIQSTAPTQSAEPFTFGAVTNNSKPGGFNFAASTNQSPAPASGGFKFGAAAASTAATPTRQNPPAYGGFGSTTSTSNTFASGFGSQPATNSTPNMFVGQQPAQATAPAFGAQTAAGVFGSTAAAPAFGAAASTGGLQSSTPTFGAGATGAAPGFGNSAPSFGAGATNSGIGFQPEPAASTFNFGASNPASGTTPGVFAFGANNSQNATAVAAAPQAASTGGFNFAQQASGFGMQGGAQNATGAPASGVFQFGANQSQTQASFNLGVGAAPGTGQRKIRKAVRRTRKT
ncbi:nuclear pore complex protein Nup153-like isoform X2 [Patiria miniata]|uniref:Nuclear pore complex protein Nup153 n=1 Tax=Patiria miniata TaxID=46514 RepID=A0A914A1Z9_PATMI|nr:nuclear pore complex protein Nup153-like isoform X2 [Patiria miniata]